MLERRERQNDLAYYVHVNFKDMLDTVLDATQDNQTGMSVSNLHLASIILTSVAVIILL